MKQPLKLKTGIVAVLILLIFVILNLTGFSSKIKNFFYLVSSSIQQNLWRAGDKTSDFFEAISEIKSLKKENEEFKLRTEGLISENSSLKELKKENETLREALELDLRKDFKLVLAQVIGKDVSQDSILINKGTKEGILKGLPVITSQKILLGRIGQVYEDFSEIILISNKESSFDAKISDKEIYGVVKGKGNLELYLDLIPKNEEISQGELVVTAALGGVFPQGLLAGVIKGIKKSDVEPFQTAEIKPSFEIKELDNLFIITNFQ